MIDVYRIGGESKLGSSDWSRPCIHRIRNTVLDAGFKALPLRSNQFRCQCPAHGGVGYNAGFRVLHDGNIQFKCFSQDCSLKDLMDSLDLTHKEFFMPDNNPLYAGRAKEHSFDECFILHVEDAIQYGKPVSDADLEKYKLMKLRAEGLVA